MRNIFPCGWVWECIKLRVSDAKCLRLARSATTAASNNRNKEVVLKSCTSFTDCISEINNTQIDNVKVWSSTEYV